MDEGFLRLMEGIERRVRDAETRNPKLRMLKDEITRAGCAYKDASTDEERRTAMNAQNEACEALMKEAIIRHR